MVIGQLFHVRNYVKNYMFEINEKYFGQNHRVAVLSMLYLSLSGITIPSLILIGQF